MSKAKRKADRIENADRYLMEEYDRCIALLDEAWSSMFKIHGFKEIIRKNRSEIEALPNQRHWNMIMGALMTELTRDKEYWERRLERRG